MKITAERCFDEILEILQINISDFQMRLECIDRIQRCIDAAVSEATTMTVHNLKSWPDAFQPVLDKKKRYEFRVNDRDYSVGDELVLQEWEPGPGEYTGRSLKVKVLHMSKGPAWEIPDGYCVMSISDPYDVQDSR